MIDHKGAKKDATRSLNSRIELWDPKGSVERDRLGTDKLKPAKIATLWADITVVRGREVSGQDNRVIAYSVTNVIIRYRPGVKPEHYLKVNGVDYEILSIKPLGNRLYLSLECQERVV